MQPLSSIDQLVSYTLGDQVEIVANDMGSRITPSWVAFTGDGEQLVGEAAKNQVGENPENTLYDVKRIIGQVVARQDLRAQGIANQARH